jgi:hypothetical protein
VLLPLAAAARSCCHAPGLRLPPRPELEARHGRRRHGLRAQAGGWPSSAATDPLEAGRSSAGTREGSEQAELGAPPP